MLYRSIVAIISVLSLISVLLIMSFTSPNEISPFGILALFVLVYVFCVGLFTFGLYWSTRVYSYIYSRLGRRRVNPITFKNSYFFSTVVAVLPVMIIGLQSVGAVSWYSNILVLLFVGLGVLYVSKVVKY
jgi:hypothetical protein